jgi:hypothetical protein
MNPKTKRNIFIGAGALVLLWLSNMAKAGVNSWTNLKLNIPGLVIGGENQGAKIKLADLNQVSNYNSSLRFKNSTTKQQAIYYNNEYAPIVWSSSQVNSVPNSNQFWNDYYLYDKAGGKMIDAPKAIGEVISSKEMIWAFGNDGSMVNLIRATLILIKADNSVKFENPSLFPNNTFYIILFPNDKTYKLT